LCCDYHLVAQRYDIFLKYANMSAIFLTKKVKNARFFCINEKKALSLQPQQTQLT